MAVGHCDARLDFVLPDGSLQVFQIHPLLRVRRNLDGLHVDRCDAPQNRKVHRALDSNHITGLCHGAETQIDGLQGPGVCREFRETLAAGGLKCLPLPARSPNLNAYAERWVRSIKEECLSKLIL